MLTKTLEMALIRAIREAKSQKHEYVTVEHMLYGLLDDELTSYIISECGGSIDGLKERLERLQPEKMLERKANEAENLNKSLSYRPLGLFVI